MILSTCRSQSSFLAARHFPGGRGRRIGRIGQIGRTNIAVGFALILAATLLSGCATRRQNQISIAPSHSIPSIWPVMCEQTHVTNRFGDAVASPNGGTHPHRGVDIAVPKGTPVIATADGWVVYADYNKNGYGRLVRVAHGAGIETWYAHLNSLDVKTGTRVKQGQQIGRVGKSGRATGFHVHYEVRVNGNPVDPGRYLTALR